MVKKHQDRCFRFRCYRYPELLSDPELLKRRYEEGRGDPTVDDGEEREKERVGRKLKALEREVGRLIDAYQAEVIDLAELKERRERIEEHGRMLKRRLTEIREKRAEREQEVRLVRGLEQFSESVAGALEDPSFETKQQVLRLVVDRIVVEDSRVVVHHVVPTGPVGLQTRHRPWLRAYLERIGPGTVSPIPSSAGSCRKARSSGGLAHKLQAATEYSVLSRPEPPHLEPPPPLFVQGRPAAVDFI